MSLAAVAVGHFDERRRTFQVFLCKQTRDTKRRLVSAGLRMDPYVIQDWNEVPEEVASDTMLVVRYSVDKI